MKFPCIVFRNGKWYQAGEDVPETVVEDNTSVAEKSVAEDLVVEDSKPAYTKAQINKMKADELKALAVKLGFDSEGIEEISLSELKRNVIDFLKI